MCSPNERRGSTPFNRILTLHDRIERGGIPAGVAADLPREDVQMVIYHIVPEQEFRTALDGPVFVPAALARDGFVHCSFEASVIAVANDYFAEVPGRLLLLELAPEKLSSETRHESPAPLLTGGSAHLDQAALFPHVYGPIDRVAITRVGVLRRTAAGFEWPTSFISLDSFLAADPPAQPPTSL